MKNFTKIEKFLKGKMPVTEAEKFKQEIADNEDLASEVELQRIERVSISLLAEDELRTKMKAILEEEKPFVRLENERKRIYLAILVIVMAIIAFILFNLPRFSLEEEIPRSDDTSIALIDKGYRLVPLSSEIRRGYKYAPLNPEYIGILNNRNRGRAKDAIDYFSSLSQIDRLLSDSLRLAHAYILDQNYRKAIDLFSEIESSKNINSFLKQRIAFYKALAFIGNNELENAKEILEELMNTKYQKVAEEILKKIK